MPQDPLSDFLSGNSSSDPATQSDIVNTTSLDNFLGTEEDEVVDPYAAAVRAAQEDLARGGGADYDYSSALKHMRETGDTSLYDHERGKWYSVVPSGKNAGRILKRPSHKTYDKTVHAELMLGNMIYSKGNREYVGRKPEESLTDAQRHNKRAFEEGSNLYYDDEHYNAVMERIGSGESASGITDEDWGKPISQVSREKKDRASFNEARAGAKYGISAAWQYMFGPSEDTNLFGSAYAAELKAATSMAISVLDSEIIRSVLLENPVVRTLDEWRGITSIERLQGWDNLTESMRGLNIGLNEAEGLRSEGFLEETTEMVVQSSNVMLATA